MEKLRKRHPELCEGWKIVTTKSDVVKKAHDLSRKELKEKVEESIETVVCQSVRDEFKKTMEGEVRDAHGILQQLEERERKLLQNDWEYQCEERKRKLIHAAQSKPLMQKDASKLRTVCGKLEKAQYKLKLLLVEADEETIKENIPEATRANCLDALSTGSNICLRIKKTIAENKRKNIEEYYSTGKKSITRITEMINLLASIVHALRAA